MALKDDLAAAFQVAASSGIAASLFPLEASHGHRDGPHVGFAASRMGQAAVQALELSPSMNLAIDNIVAALDARYAPHQ
jgi:hypothetical protein